MKNNIYIMIVEDEKIAAKAIEDALKAEGYSCFVFYNAEEALLFFKEKPIDIAILDYKLPSMNGEELFFKLREINPTIPIIFMTAYGSVEKAVRLLKNGAYNYLTKPIEIDELLHNIKNLENKLILERENEILKTEIEKNISFNEFIFESQAMKNILNLSLRSAKSEANILITGESGTGKEVIANIIHNYSKRKRGKLIKVNLAAIPDTLIESELFGSTKGAYTGAFQTRMGKFEEANGGTIFLDEIGELPIEIQVKLLRVIQEREITKLGSNSPVKVDIRLITATNKNLEELIKENKFREDLYFRLNVINIHLPALRERKEDIPYLIDLFIKKYRIRENKEITGISKDALNLLIKYEFPGNIRELENMIERAVVLTRKEIISVDDLPVFLLKLQESNKDSIYNEIIYNQNLSLPERLNLIEKDIIKKTLKKNNYNQTKTAKELGISESGLRYKIQALKIKK